MKLIYFNLICLVLVIGGAIYFSGFSDDKTVEEKPLDTEEDFIYYGDNVRVSKSIAEGYGDSNYIPRSVLINKELERNG